MTTKKSIGAMEREKHHKQLKKHRSIAQEGKN